LRLGLTLFVFTLGLNILALYDRAQIPRAIRMTEPPPPAARCTTPRPHPPPQRRRKALPRLWAFPPSRLAILALAMLLVSILGNGLGAFRQTFDDHPVTLDAAVLDKAGNRNPDEMKKVTTVGYGKIICARRWSTPSPPPACRWAT
jgi:hypothetical protein